MAQIHFPTVGSDIQSLKTRLQKTWMAGDYDRFSRYMEEGARRFYERLDIPPGARVLDVGCGSGQLALSTVDPLRLGIALARGLRATHAHESRARRLRNTPRDEARNGAVAKRRLHRDQPGLLVHLGR